MFCDVGREAGHQCAQQSCGGSSALALVAAGILHVDGVSRRLMPTNCAVTTATSGAAFNPADSGKTRRRVRAAATRRQTMLNRCGTGNSRGRCDSRHSSWASLLSDEATSIDRCARPAESARTQQHCSSHAHTQPASEQTGRELARRGVNKAFSESCYQRLPRRATMRIGKCPQTASKTTPPSHCNCVAQWIAHQTLIWGLRFESRRGYTD